MASQTKVTRGVRNNNPGNIRRSNEPWQGLKPIQNDMEFFQFVSPDYGIRAIARILIKYQDARKARDGSKIDTVREIIERWAPPSENNTVAYVKAMRKALGLDVPEYPGEVDVHQYADAKALVTAIIAHECAGYIYPEEVVDQGLMLAGIKRPQKALAHTNTMRAATAQVSTGTITAGAALLVAAQPAIGPLGELAALVRHNWPGLLVLIGLITIGTGLWTAYARWTDWRRGLK